MAFSTGARADEHETYIHGLHNNDQITLAGTVNTVGKGYLMLRTGGGDDILVRLPQNSPEPFAIGDSVTVSGTVNKPLFGALGNELQATSVQRNFHS